MIRQVSTLIHWNTTYGWAEGVKVGDSVGELVGRIDGLLVGATEGLCEDVG